MRKIFTVLLALLLLSCASAATKDAQYWQNKGLDDLNNAKYSRAERDFKKALSLDPYDARANNNLGRVYFRTKKYKKAIASFEKAVSIMPEALAAHENLGRAYLRAGMLDEARLHQEIVIAADRLDIDRHLADRLAGVEQEGNAGIPGDAADRGGGVHEPAIGRHMGDRDQLDLVVEHVGERLGGYLAALVAGNRLDRGAGGAGGLQAGDIVAGVFGFGRQDAVAFREAEGIERHVPGAGCVLDHGDLIGRAVEKPGGGRIDAFNLLTGVRGGLITAGKRLGVEVALDRVQDRRGQEAGTGIVEMEDAVAAGRLGPGARNVECHRGQVWSISVGAGCNVSASIGRRAGAVARLDGPARGSIARCV